MSAGSFLLLRLIRLYPLYLLGLTLGAAPVLYELIRGRESQVTVSVNMMTGILFLPSPATPNLFPIDGPAWSLFFELIANFLFAVAIARWKFRSLAALVGVAAIVLTASVSLRLFGFNQPGAAVMGVGHLWTSFNGGIIRVTFSFFTGQLLYRIWRRQKISWHLDPIWASAILAAILLSQPPKWADATFALFAATVAFPAIILGAASSQPGTQVSKFFSFIGRASYGVYILHYPMFVALAYVLFKLSAHVATHLPEAAGIAFVIFVFWMVSVIDFYYDAPLREFLYRRVSAKRILR